MTITLATLPQATAQEVYSQVRKHLLTQKIKSIGKRERCAYYGTDGLMCAAGCLIAKEEYTVTFEGNAWDHLADTGRVPKAHQELISDLQAIHDRRDSANWEHFLDKLAADFNLEPK